MTRHSIFGTDSATLEFPTTAEYERYKKARHNLDMQTYALLRFKHGDDVKNENTEAMYAAWLRTHEDPTTKPTMIGVAWAEPVGLPGMSDYADEIKDKGRCASYF